MKYIIDVPDEAIELMGGHISVFVEPEFKTGECKHYALRLSKEDLVPYAQLDHKAIEDEVWKFAMDCIKMDGADFWHIFESSMVDRLTDFSYHEAKAKFEAWLKQKDELHVGDEIVGIYSDGGKTPPLVVLKVEGDYYYGMYSKTGEFTQGGLNYEKTGRHFSEVAELLEKMRGGKE